MRYETPQVTERVRVEGLLDYCDYVPWACGPGGGKGSDEYLPPTG